MKTLISPSFCHSDEETYAKFPILGGTFFLETDCKKYKGFFGRPKGARKKILRPKAAEMREIKAFCGLKSVENRTFWHFVTSP